MTHTSSTVKVLKQTTFQATRVSGYAYRSKGHLKAFCDRLDGFLETASKPSLGKELIIEEFISSSEYFK